MMALGLAVATACLYFAFRNVEFARLRYTLGGAHGWYALPCLACVIAFYRFKASRWAMLLSPQVAASGSQLFPAVMVGYGINTLVPFQVGDVFRSRIGAQRTGLKTALVLVTIVLERVFDMLSLVLPLGLALALLPDVPRAIELAAVMLLVGAGIALAVFFYCVYFTDQLQTLARRIRDLAPARVGQIIERQLTNGLPGLAAIRDSRLLGKLFAISMAHWAFWCVAIYLSMRAVHIDAAPAAALFVTVLLVIGTNLPNSPGYVGSIQLAFVLGLEAFGVLAEDALAASVFFHFVAYPAIVVAGLGYLWACGTRPRPPA
jgi:uncharacterized protein (TIRG00374 family)